MYQARAFSLLRERNGALSFVTGVGKAVYKIWASSDEFYFGSHW